MTNDNPAELPSITTSDILSNIDGIPLPPAIKKSLWKSIGKLITGLADVPVALLEAKVQQIKSKADALSLVTKSAAEAASIQFGQDKDLIDRMVNHMGSRLFNEQMNRESTVGKAIEDLRLNPPTQDSKEEIDSDWLEMFSRIAETKSNEDVQLFLSKILAGEIRKPGSFGPKTIQTLSLLDQRTAKLFLSFCSISFEITQMGDSQTCVICEPFGSPGNNGLLPVGLSYSNLTQLQDAGLIQHDLNAWKQIPAIIFSMPIKIGNTNFSFTLTEETPKATTLDEMPKVNVINFTAVGLELRKVMHISNSQVYNDKFVDWIKTRFKLTIANQ